MENIGRLGVEGNNLSGQLATSVVEGRDGGSVARKGVVKERQLQIVSVTTQVAISRRVSRFKLQLRDRQDVRGSQGGGDDGSSQEPATNSARDEGQTKQESSQSVSNPQQLSQGMFQGHRHASYA